MKARGLAVGRNAGLSNLVMLPIARVESLTADTDRANEALLCVNRSWDDLEASLVFLQKAYVCWARRVVWCL